MLPLISDFLHGFLSTCRIGASSQRAALAEAAQMEFGKISHAIRGLARGKLLGASKLEGACAVAINDRGVSAASVGELLDDDLRIPHYQRPYVWTPSIAFRLFLDIRDAQQAAIANVQAQSAPYVLGAVILHENGKYLDVVDGQQRLLTLRMLLRILNGEQSPSSKTMDSASPVAEVWRALQNTASPMQPNERLALASFIRDKCHVIRVVTDDVDEAFRVFDSQNYRGRPLAPHDLLKAHHLREMRRESDALKAATVEEWESVGDDALDELFSLYLYRIAKWSKGETAPGFTIQDIHMFKGISSTGRLSPNSRYHAAAQSMIPLMSQWHNSNNPEDEIDVLRSRFQIDAPLLAGRPFFEMAAFMLREISTLKERSFPVKEGPKDSAKIGVTFGDKLAESRYRKVTELYLAGMLYYVNKFSDDDIDLASDHLFAWSFDIRLRYLRVGQASINNAGYGKDNVVSPFVQFRNSSDGHAVRTFVSTGRPYNDGHERELFALLNGTAT
ncbi:hypothetical protein NtRootA9_10810 [Arthrobacter sp. NtRootA9]|nr:hypothetical protein NtRootA9_10810 [Arthrobacter sp. NtRootA9]